VHVRARPAALVAGAALIGSVALVGAAGPAGGATAPTRPPAGSSPAAGSSPTPPSGPGILDGLSAAAPVPVPARVAAALAGPLADPALGHVAAYVVDAITGQVLLDHGGNSAARPASTAKILLAATALHVLGAPSRLHTTVAQAPNGDLVLVGGGDPTLTAAAAGAGYPVPARLTDLAAATASALRGAAGTPRPAGPVTLLVDGSAFTGPELADGWSPGDVSGGSVAPVEAVEVDGGRFRPGVLPTSRTYDPALAAGSAFRSALAAAGVHVGPVRLGHAPAGSRPLAHVDSPPVSALVERMLTTSDNDLAEALGRLSAHAAGRPATFDGAVETVQATLTALGIPQPVHGMHDASGLSRLDRMAPETIVGVLAAAAGPRHPELRPLLAALPVAGFTGTVAGRFHTPDSVAAAGVARVKTGTLAGVGSLAGIVVDRSGRLLAFALLATPGSRFAGEEALDRVAAALAGCGCS
jgi:D-alanyl-D-alanine carboxypeptidase/D-alanyl-D-alanine-endopeptidase (penicillin-binding protein 4)